MKTSTTTPPEACWYTGLKTRTQLMKNIPVAINTLSSTPRRFEVRLPRAPGKVSTPPMARGSTTAPQTSPTTEDLTTSPLRMML